MSPDQFVLELLAFRLLTREPVFPVNDEEWEERILNELMPSAHTTNPDLEPLVDRILSRVWATRGAHRYPTCAAFVADLREAVFGPR